MEEEAEAEVSNSELDCKEDSISCRCSELEETSKKAEERIVELESEIEKRKGEYEGLEIKFEELEARKCLVEDELMQSYDGENKTRFTERKGKEEGEVMVVDLTKRGDKDEDEEAIVHQLMVENFTLEYEKKKALNEVEVWKRKFRELELWVSQVDEGTIMKGGKQLLNEIIKSGIGPDVRASIEHLQINLKSLDPVPNCTLPGKGTPYKDSSCDHTPLTEEKGFGLKSEGECHRVVRRHLSFNEERSPNKKMAPSTPGGGKPVHLNVIDICDSDDESNVHVSLSIPNDQGNRKVSISTNHMLTRTLDGKQDMISENCFGRVVGSQDYEDDLDYCKDNVPCTPASKRKRGAKMVISDSESDKDDNTPISKLKKMHLQESIADISNSDVNCCSISASPANNDIKCTITRSRRRLATLRQCEETVKAERSFSDKNGEFKHGQGISTTDDFEDSESEEIGSDSDGESLGGFIVDSSDVSDADKFPSQSDNKSDGGVDFDEILSKLQRSKDHAFKWELEADMLSAFGKDDELCMKAVCALYRQQTSDEQVSKETMHNNQRGFSKFDARRGSDLARFLTDGDPHGDLKKSVQQLEELGPKAVKLCRSLANRYSKQLFEIYKNKEDPLFLPN